MKVLREMKEREERGEPLFDGGDGDDDEGREKYRMDVRNGWGKIGEPVPRTGVAVFDRASTRYSSARTGTRGTEGGGYYNVRDSLDFPPPPIVPRRSLANASAYDVGMPGPSSSTLSSLMPSSPPPPASYSYSLDASVDGTQDSAFSTGTGTMNGNGNGSVAKRKRDGDDWESVPSRGGRRASPGPPTTRVDPIASASTKGPFFLQRYSMDRGASGTRLTSTNSPQPLFFCGQTGNPFARKKAPEAPAPTANPFARKAGGNVKPIDTLKSTSFMQKIDAAEGEVNARK